MKGNTVVLFRMPGSTVAFFKGVLISFFDGLRVGAEGERGGGGGVRRLAGLSCDPRKPKSESSC